MVAVVTASVVPSMGGGHAHGEGEGHDDHGVDGTGEMAAGHEHGGATGGGGGDEWNARRIAALTGYLPDVEAERYRALNAEFLSEQIRARSETLGDLPEAEREERIAEFVDWSVDHALEAEQDAASSGEPTMHSHGITEWQDLTDPAEQTALQAELQVAGQVIAAMPTAADAVAAGYFQVTPYVPGIGAHYLNVRLLSGDGFDPAKPEMLLYNGNEPTSATRCWATRHRRASSVPTTSGTSTRRSASWASSWSVRTARPTTCAPRSAATRGCRSTSRCGWATCGRFPDGSHRGGCSAARTPS
jgi:hypothetical protein